MKKIGYKFETVENQPTFLNNSTIPNDNLNMNSYTIFNLGDTLGDDPSQVATVEYVNNKFLSQIQNANINILTSQGFFGSVGSETGKDLKTFRYFPSGLILPEKTKIIKISLTTTPISGNSVSHKLNLILNEEPFTNKNTKVITLLNKTSDELYKTTNVLPWIVLNKETSIVFELESNSITGNTSVPVFNGQSVVTIHVELN